MKSLRNTVALLALALPAMQALPHHSFAMFDQSQRVTLKGKVTDFQWTNPHAFIHLEVTGAEHPGQLGTGAEQPQQPQAPGLDGRIVEVFYPASSSLHQADPQKSPIILCPPAPAISQSALDIFLALQASLNEVDGIDHS